MKSDESDCLELALSIYLDACAKCPAAVSDLRDVQTLTSRVKSEGLSFRTITLPSFAKAFERSHANGFIDYKLFRNFRKSRAIPAFLQGMLSRLFDHETGRLIDEEFSSIYVEAVRQICLSFKKIELPCSEKRNKAAIENFIQVEQDFDDFRTDRTARDSFLAVSDHLWHNLLGSYDPSSLVPRHGPGATAERISGNAKYVWRVWHERLERCFPFLENGYSVSIIGSDEEHLFDKVTFVPWDQEQPVRVHLVPKTLKSPRIIAIEPVCMQYAQQAVRDFLYERLESDPLTRGQVNFTDQTFNRDLALESSRTGRFSTIDLSDASDRVPASLAMSMFSSVPDLSELIRACRSYRALLPDGRLVSLRKFASMGSALCFPVQAMYYYTICVLACLDANNLPYTYENCFTVSRSIYVYGDDLIVPTDQAETILDYLRKYNCKVNDSKTFVTGKFRESCGIDAYDGHEVTPTYVRSLRPENRQQVASILSYVATANLFYKKGYWRAASLMFCTCERILGPLPYVSEESEALGRVSFLGYRSANGWNGNTHSLRLKGWVTKPVYRSDKIGGYSALQKTLIALERRSPPLSDSSESPVLSRLQWVEPSAVDKKHLERSARRGLATLKSRWVLVT